MIAQRFLEKDRLTRQKEATLKGCPTKDKKKINVEYRSVLKKLFVGHPGGFQLKSKNNKE